MGFDEGRIVLDSDTGNYFAGQTINGRLIFDQEKEKTFRGIYIKFKGICKVHWTTSHSRTVNNETQRYTEVHESHEEYFNSKFYLIGGEKGEHTIQPGHYEYPFQYPIPPSCPSSFQGSNGHISYEIKVVVDRAYKIDQTKTISFGVVAPLDLNLDPYCKEPIEMEFEDTYCCWCMSAGHCTTIIKIPKAGFTPGQKIPIEIGCTNSSNVDIDVIRFVLKRELTFRAETNPDTRSESEDVIEIKQGPIPANTTRNLNVDLAIPVMDVYNVNSCRYIDIDHVLKVSIETSGCHENSDASRRIVIGTIPLVGFQDDVANPILDRMPQTNIVPQQNYPGYGITTQPLPTGGYPYPSNTPYPTPGQPTPYPTPGQPNPYPVSPGFITNPPYPAPAGPYPAANGYPAPANTPYPPQGSPYPPLGLFPPGNAPYPNQPSPYASHIPLNKDGSNLPLLPITGTVPMPKHEAASPFVGASAPEPSTPDIDGKPTSPYNPDFVKAEGKN